jgi:hypothetical protein
MNQYFIIHGYEGPIHIEGPLSWQEVEKRITPNPKEENLTHYGELDGFFDKVPEQDHGCWFRVSGNKLLIIKGEIVVPKPVAVATKFEEPR